ncbi:MAG: PfkB family carbohydrate kinase [Bacteroidia bacterium]|nr:PfkB family carbohydrate kinase [Bacteroidia bacterium]
MNIVILGHLVLDEIHTFDGGIIESAGGITFPLSAFAAASAPEDVLLPVFPYGSDAGDVLRGLLRDFPNIDASHCTAVAEANTRVRLFHDAHAGYNTQLVSSLGSISRDSLQRVLPQAQLVYLNMMTGQDILPSEAALLRDPGRLVYLDLHMIAYRVRPDGHREPAAPSDWAQWARATDVLQCNEREFAAFLPDDADDASRVRRLFDAADLRCVVITRGEKGADIFLPSGERAHVPAEPVTRLVDTTGCGDTFGSVFALGLARNENVELAARRAARAASFVASVPGSHGIGGLRAVLAEALP